MSSTISAILPRLLRTHGMLSDHDDRKWGYGPHTAAKHRLLARYMQAWLPILGQNERRFGRTGQLVIVDAFAGRGRYATEAGEPGSPLILLDIAMRAVAENRVDEVELFFIESNRTNAERLRAELGACDRVPGVIVHDPYQDRFEAVAPEILKRIESTRRPSFWFIDPFGFAGLPLPIIRDVLRPARAEVFITIMAQAVNRFIDQSNHQQAMSELLDLRGEDLLTAIDRVKRASRRIEAFSDLYQERLRAGAEAQYVWLYRVAQEGPADTIYYLVHGSNHPKALREMKKAAWAVSGPRRAFIGPSDPTETGQIDMFSGDVVAGIDLTGVKELLRHRFRGREIEYEELQNRIHSVQPEMAPYVDEHVRQALDDLAEAGLVTKFREGMPSRKALRNRDQLRFRSD